MTQHILHKYTLRMYITQEKQQDKLYLRIVFFYTSLRGTITNLCHLWQKC